MNEIGRGRVRQDVEFGTLENQLRTAGRQFVYPPTPNVAAGETRTARRYAPRVRLAWAVAVLVLLLGLWSVPTVRASVVEWLQIGAVRIQLVAPTATVAPPTGTPRATVIPTATPVPLANVLKLSGETTLAEARAQLDIPLRLPQYPADLGTPDRVVVQRLSGGGSLALFIWLDDNATESNPTVRLSLMQMEADAFMTKGEPRTIRETTIGDHYALWTEGPYGLNYQEQGTRFERLVDGHVLIWTEQIDGEEITYRLETDWSLDEARRVAESLE